MYRPMMSGARSIAGRLLHFLARLTENREGICEQKSSSELRNWIDLGASPSAISSELETEM